jgi:nitroreductase
MDVEQAIQQRGAVRAYDPDVTIDDDELAAIFELVSRSPSSFNLQHGRFVCLRDQAVKDRVMEAAWNQGHVGGCSVTVVVCAKLTAYEDAARCWEWAPQDVAERMVSMIGPFYEGKPQLQRDEALRSGSLAAMTLMLVAQSRGWNTCPMIGFDPEQVSQIIGLPDDHVPVMVVTLGRGTVPAHSSERLPLAELVKLDGFGGPSLQA